MIPAQDYLDHFASDRSHMASSGMAFPAWPILRGSKASGSMNLQEYIDMSRDGDRVTDYNDEQERCHRGKVYSLKEFIQWASR